MRSGGWGAFWKAERERAERRLTERLRKGQPYEITAYLRNVLLGKVCVFWEVLQIFHRQLFFFFFIFWVILLLPPLPPPPPPFLRSVVWTNCVALCPLSQYRDVYSPPPLACLSKHPLIVCVFLNAKENMSVYFSSAWVQAAFFFFFFFSQV